MEEMVTLQYSSFAAMGEYVKVVALPTGHLKRVADQALFLDELRRAHLGWNTIWHQEWRLFLLERLLNNAAAMQRKE